MHRIILLCLTTFLVCGCSWLKIYRMDVDQGNLIDEATVQQVRVGMSKEEVRQLLGDPLLQDFFHASRWDYVTFLQPAEGPATRKHFWLEFKADRLVAIHHESKN